MTRLIGALLPLLLLGACSGDGDGDAPSAFSAIPASFDIAAGSPQRFLLGLIGPEQESVEHGEVDLEFSYLGTKDDPIKTPEVAVRAGASFVAVGEDGHSGAVVELSEVGHGRGVYVTDALTFADAGFWEVRASFEADGRAADAAAAFEVLDAHQVVAVGTSAPAIANPTMDVPPPEWRMLDSRATSRADVPDPELHRTSIAAARAAGRPLVVVVSTPAYCTSRFCGPITDVVGEAARRWADDVDFVHIEVWADIQAEIVNPDAALWVRTPEGEMPEPFVFVVDRAGIVRARFDNVVPPDALDAEVAAVIE